MDDALYDRADWRSFVKLRLEQLGLTQRDLALRADLGPGHVSMLLRGQRPLAPHQDELARALELDAEGLEWFAALADLEAPSERARQSAYATVRSRLQQRATRDPDLEVLEAQGTWYVGVVAELAACVGFRPDPAWIARTVVPNIGEDEAREALHTLLRLGVLSPREDGGWTVVEMRTASVLSKEQSAPASRQRDGFRAFARPARFRSNESHDGIAPMAVSEARAERILARLRDLEQELVQLAIEDPGPRTRVLLLWTQLFPVSDYTDTEDGQSIETSRRGSAPE